MVPSDRSKLLAVAAMIPPVLLVLLALWLSGMSRYDGGAHAPAWVRDVVWHHRFSILLALGIASAVAPLVIALQAWGHRRRAIAYFLDHLHARLWTKEGTRDPEYRIALLVPRLWRRWLTCYYRTDGRRSRRWWTCRPPKDDRAADGLACAVWQTGMCIQVGSPPKNATQNELALYRTLAFLRERDCEDRSWPTAAMLGVPVQDPITCRPIGVLLIERNRHKAKIEGVEVADTAHDTYVCAMILQGRL